MASDPRVVYGARCAWWDTIEKTATVNGKPDGLPCCPNCGSPLFEVASESVWWNGVEAHDDMNPGYREFVEWLRGKCFPGFPEAIAHYEEETGKHVEQ